MLHARKLIALTVLCVVPALATEDVTLHRFILSMSACATKRASFFPPPLKTRDTFGGPSLLRHEKVTRGWEKGVRKL